MEYTTQSGMKVDESRIVFLKRLKKLFTPLYFKEYIPLTTAIAENILTKDSVVFAGEVKEKFLVLDATQMHFHHVAQGKFENQYWLFGFCGICNSGACFDSSIDGKELVFSTVGLYNGYALWGDSATNSLWEHITGECLKGKYEGAQLSFLSNLLEYKIADLQKLGKEIYVLHKRKTGLQKILHQLKFSVIGMVVAFQKKVGILPPIFIPTLGVLDDRLHRDTLGICVWEGNYAKFYTKAAIDQNKKIMDIFGKKTLILTIHEHSKIPYAQYKDGSEPKQNFMRWYGASAAFPTIVVHEM